MVIRALGAGFLLLTAPFSVPGQEAAPGKWNRESLINAALGSGHDYLASQSRSRQAQAVLGEARAARLPVLRFSSSLSRLTNPPGLTVKAGALFPGVPPVIPALPAEDTAFTLSENTSYKFGLSLEQPLFTWGRIQHSIEAAALGSQAGLLAQSLEARNLHTAVDSYLAALAFIEKTQTLLAEQERKAQRLMVLSEESYAAGFILNTDLLEARLLAAEVSLAGYESREQASKTLLALRNLTGITGLELEQIELPSGLASFFSEDGPPEAGGGGTAAYTSGGRDELLSMLYRDNSSLRILGLQARAREELLEAARGRSLGKPELGLFAELDYSGPRLPFVQDGWDTENRVNLTASLGIRALLFDGGAVQNSIRQKEEETIQARLELDRGRRDLEAYLENTLLGLDVSRRRQEYLSLRAEAEKIRSGQAEEAWRAGYGEERDFLTHELIWYKNRIELYKEKLSALLAVLELENLLEIDHAEKQTN